MPVDGKPKMDSYTNEKAQSKREGDDPCDGFTATRLVYRKFEKGEGKKKEERERGKTSPPIPCLHRCKPRAEGERQGKDVGEVFRFHNKVAYAFSRK